MINILLCCFQPSIPVKDIVMNQPMKDWAPDDRPREKLWNNGEQSLSNAELLAILLRNGMKGRSALDLAREVLFRFKTFQAMGHLDAVSWRQIKGLGPAKIAQIRAALEAGVEVIFGSWYFTSISAGWSPELYRDLFVPLIREHVELTHSYGAYYDFYDDGKLAHTMAMIAATRCCSAVRS